MKKNDAPKLIDFSIGLLKNMFDEKSYLFSYSTEIVNGKYYNDYSNHKKYRYTLNVLMGLQKLESYYEIPWNVNILIDKFASAHFRSNLSVGDMGILLHLLCLANHEKTDYVYNLLAMNFQRKKRVMQLSIQEISWVSIGITTYANHTGKSESIEFANRIINYLCENYMNKKTFLPKHNYSIRGFFVSFGGVAYFLMSLYHYATSFNDSRIKDIFIKAVRKVISLQGINGEWPWFIDSTTSRIMDWYQVYSVHQDSMAMLFLLPALDMGIDESSSAITKSLNWLFGGNQLDTQMIIDNPFFIWRSIRRRKTIGERAMRLNRSYMQKIVGTEGKFVKSSFLDVNQECRSYHIGWIIYAWADRSDFKQFINLESI